MLKQQANNLTFSALKEKQRRIRQDFPENLALRVHRAISWLGRAQAETEDADVRFILLWVGFNSAYAGDIKDDVFSERGAFKTYFKALVSLDTGHRIYNFVWQRFSQEIRLLLGNRYVFAPFWHHHNGVPGYGDWEEQLRVSQTVIGTAMTNRDTVKILTILFDRLYVLRNQMVHGGSTWNSTINRDQVRDGAAVIGWLLPVFIDVMMDHPSRDWGRPFYPVIA